MNIKAHIINRSQVTKLLEYFPDHQFEWKWLPRAPEYTRKRKVSKALLIKSINPSFGQVHTEPLVLCRNGVT